jgi:serine phosphatase RsbU (regulator of sigma subunit)
MRMGLRSRLVVAFLLLSVLPLAAVTAYSYRSSLRAFHEAVQAEASALAGEMERRMDEVTAELEDRVDRLWEVPVRAAAGTPGGGRPEPPAPRPPTRPRAQPGATPALAGMLGELAKFLERIEFTPSAEAARAAEAPATGRSPATGRRPRAGRPPRAAPPASPVIIDLRALVSEAVKDDAEARAAAERALTLLEDLQTKYGPLATLGLRGAALGLELGAAQLERLAARGGAPAGGGTPATGGRRAWMRGGWLGIPVTREGQTVGEVKAKVNLPEVLHSVLSRTRRDQGEIPFAIDETGQLYTVSAADRRALDRLAIAGDPPVPQTREPWVVVTRKDPRGMTFGIARPVGAPLAAIRRTAAGNLALGLFVIVVALAGIYPVSAHMTRHLAALIDGARAIARGRLETRVPVRSWDEFGELAGAFNHMAEALAAHQQALVEQERLRRELELCREIQHQMLPRAPLHVGVTEVRGVSIPAREVGGDFFNYFLMPRGELALVVGDVSGKGVSAALLMANIQATLRARLPLERDLTSLAEALDRDVDQTTPRGVFLTLFVGVLEPDAAALRYVNAGHNPQFVLRRAGGIEHLPATGLPIGLFPGHGYQERRVTLHEGDLLFFYTDGIVEAENDLGDYFGIARLEALLAGTDADAVGDVLARVERAVREFRGAADPIDDATLMAVRVGRMHSA